MAGLTYMCSLIGDTESASEQLTLQTWTITTLTSSRHAELLLLDGIMRRRMETLSQEGLDDPPTPQYQWCERMRYGIGYWTLRLEKNFGSLFGNWLLLTSPDVILTYPNTVTGDMLHQALGTTDLLAETFVSRCRATLDSSDGSRLLIKSVMDNLVSSSSGGASSLRYAPGASPCGSYHNPPSRPP